MVESGTRLLPCFIQGKKSTSSCCHHEQPQSADSILSRRKHRAFARGSVIKPQLRSMLIRTCLGIEVSNFTNFLHHATTASSATLHDKATHSNAAWEGERVTRRGQAGEVAAVRLACACDADDAGCVRWHNEGLVWQREKQNETCYAEQSTRVRLREGQPSGGNKQRCAEVRPPQTRESARAGRTAAGVKRKQTNKGEHQDKERSKRAATKRHACGTPRLGRSGRRSRRQSHPARVVCPPYV